MARIELKPLPPKEAVKHFRRKGFTVGFSWEDVWEGEHARAFTVAKAMQLDLLSDIRAAVDKAIAEGQSLNQFRAEFTPILQKRGWWGKQLAVDRWTGEETIAQLGSPHRLKTIYDVNLRTSHAAGNWEKIERLKARRPSCAIRPYTTIEPGRST